MRRIWAAAAAVIFGLSLASNGVSAKTGVKVGVLSCGIEPGIGFVILSQKRLSCVYQPSGGGRIERYRGKITRVGLDIGVTSQSVVVWAVLAPGKTRRGALQGGYGGLSAEATVVVGLGANLLIGGFEKSITLQPLSVQAQTGFDVAAGVAGLSLRYVK